jgi:acyl carrier protein
MGLDGVELLVAVEKKLDIEITNTEAEKIETVGHFHDCVWKLVQNKEGNQLTRTEIEDIINYTIHDLCSINLKEITPEKRIVKDLGID